MGLAAAAFLSAGLAMAAGEPVIVRTGTLEGVAMQIDGKTPAAGMEIVLRREEAPASLLRASAGIDGAFQLTDVGAGAWQVYAGGKPAGRMLAAQGGTVTRLVILAAPESAGAAAGPGGYEFSTILIAGVSATAVAVPLTYALVQMAQAPDPVSP